MKITKKRILNLEFSKTLIFLSVIVLIVLIINFIRFRQNMDYLNSEANNFPGFFNSIGDSEDFIEIIDINDSVMSVLNEDKNSYTKISYEKLNTIYNEINLFEIVPFKNNIFRIEYREFDDKFYVFLNTSEENSMEIFLKWLDFVDKKGKYKDRIFIYDKIHNSQLGGPPVD